MKAHALSCAAMLLAAMSTVVFGCASSIDEGASTSADALSAGGGATCRAPSATTDGYPKEQWADRIGFDPVHDEGGRNRFCFDLATHGSTLGDDLPEVESEVYAKCMSYAKVFNIDVVFRTYLDLQLYTEPTDSMGSKEMALRTEDEVIAGFDRFCVTPADESACARTPDRAACLRASTQMVAGAKERLRVCLDGRSLADCLDGSAEYLVP